MSPAEAWRQAKYPVIAKLEKLYVRLPYSTHNRAILAKHRCHDPVWDKVRKQWIMPGSRFEELIGLLAEHFGGVYVIQRSSGHKCSASCWHAEKHDCECSCGGRFHGHGKPVGVWAEINEALAVKKGELFVRFMVS